MPCSWKNEVQTCKQEEMSVVCHTYCRHVLPRQQYIVVEMTPPWKKQNICATMVTERQIFYAKCSVQSWCHVQTANVISHDVSDRKYRCQLSYNPASKFINVYIFMTKTIFNRWFSDQQLVSIMHSNYDDSLCFATLTAGCVPKCMTVEHTQTSTYWQLTANRPRPVLFKPLLTWIFGHHLPTHIHWSRQWFTDYCGMWLLIHALQSYFWHLSPHLSGSYHVKDVT